jgi:hypothetical protein
MAVAPLMNKPKIKNRRRRRIFKRRERSIESAEGLLGFSDDCMDVLIQGKPLCIKPVLFFGGNKKRIG